MDQLPTITPTHIPPEQRKPDDKLQQEYDQHQEQLESNQKQLENLATTLPDHLSKELAPDKVAELTAPENKPVDKPEELTPSSADITAPDKPPEEPAPVAPDTHVAAPKPEQFEIKYEPTSALGQQISQAQQIVQAVNGAAGGLQSANKNMQG
jgi:hypothetical protein